MKNRIFQNNEGISPVLGFILILAIGVTLLTTVQLSFVPVWNTQEELDHIKLMQDDFKVLKSNIESGIQSGTTLSSPLIMGFKYSSKMLVYNPRDEAYASLEISNNTWVEVRYNEVFPEGMTDETSIKNISTGMITYVLRGAQNYNSFIYENGLIRRSGSDYTTNSQTVLANNTIFLPGVKALEYGTLSGVEKRTVNIYPTSQQKNSVIGKNVWLILHTDPDYVDWWGNNLENEGATVRKKDRTNGIVIANISSSLVIKMGEAYISTSQKASPPHSPATRLVKVSGQGTALPVGGTTSITVEVQDMYNNPVPNVLVSFRINTTRTPGNAGSTAPPLTDSVVSGTDGRASVTLTANDAGFYYIDASLIDYKTTLVYSASSQGGVMKLDYLPKNPDSVTYDVTAILTDSFGNPPPLPGSVTFDTSDGFVSPAINTTGSGGIYSTILNVSNATGIKITNIKLKDTTKYSANITWDTINNVTVTAKSGNLFNSINVPTNVDTSGCVFYGASPGNHSTQACDVPGSSHTAALYNLLSGTPYYFIINSSRPDGTSVNSTEYMFVTEGTGDDTPPASVTGLVNVTYKPLYITWTWTDPTDADFDHVEVKIDDVSAGTVAKGIQSFNATYLMPNSSHNISIRTVDTSNNANATWVKHNATTPSLFTYLFEYTIYAAQGNVTYFSNAQSDADSGAAALFNETQLSDIPERHNYTYVTSKSETNGTVTNFAEMQNNATGFASMIEERNNLSALHSWSFTPPIINNGSWIFSYTYTTVTSSTTVKGGSNDADGVPPGSLFASLSATTNNNRNVITSWKSPNFTWTNGTPLTAILNFSFRVTQLTPVATRATSAVFLIDPNGVIKQINQSTLYAAQGAWGNFSNGSIVLNDFSIIGNYSILLNATLFTTDNTGIVNVSWDNPTLTLNYSTYSLNITTDTASVPDDTSQYLEINYSRDAADTYGVYVWNGSDWNNMSSLNASVGTWAIKNITLSPIEYNSGNPRVRYIDENPSGASRGNLSIDYQRIHGYTPGIPGGYHLDIRTNTSGIPDAANQKLHLMYNATGDNFTLQLYNGSSFLWDDKETLNKSATTLVEVPLTTDYLLSDGNFGTYTVNNLPRYYVLVRYVDNRDAAPGGNLYLDYQRVYSS